MATVTKALETYFQASGIFANVLILAIPIVLASFEFSVLAVKSGWIKASGDDYHRIIEKASGDAIKSNTPSTDLVLASRLSFQSEYAFQDHVASFASAVFRLATPLLQSKVLGSFMTVALGFALVYLLWSETAFIRRVTLKFVGWLSGVLGI